MWSFQTLGNGASARGLLAYVVSACVLPAASAHAQDLLDTREAVPESVLETRAVLVAAFPEVQRQGLTWRVTSTPDGFVVEARPAVNPMSRSALPVLLSASVVTDPDGRVSQLRTGGRLIENVRNRVSSAVGRSGVEIDSVLLAAKAKLRPSDVRSESRVLPAGVKEALKASVVSISFRAGSREAPADALAWSVQIDTSGDAPGSAELTFDPVEGRLLSLVRR